MRTLVLLCALHLSVLAQSTPRRANAVPIVVVTKQGGLFVNGRAININNLVMTIQQRFGSPAVVYVRADKETAWDPMVQVLTRLEWANMPVKFAIPVIPKAVPQ